MVWIDVSWNQLGPCRNLVDLCFINAVHFSTDYHVSDIKVKAGVLFLDTTFVFHTFAPFTNTRSISPLHTWVFYDHGIFFSPNYSLRTVHVWAWKDTRSWPIRTSGATYTNQVTWPFVRPTRLSDTSTKHERTTDEALIFPMGLTQWLRQGFRKTLLPRTSDVAGIEKELKYLQATPCIVGNHKFNNGK